MDENDRRRNYASGVRMMKSQFSTGASNYDPGYEARESLRISDSVPRARNPEGGFVMHTAQTLEQYNELRHQTDDMSVRSVTRPRKGHDY